MRYTIPKSDSTEWDKRAPRWFVWLGLIALAGYALFLAANSAAVAAGPDSSGYFNSARLLAAGEFRTKLRVPPEFGSQAEVNSAHFSPLGFKLFPHHPDLVPSYPTGLPLHFAIAGKLFGWEVGPFVVQLLAAVGAVWLCYLVARELGVGFRLAGAGAAMLAVFPVFIFTSIQTLSDTLATTWALGAFFCALRARVSRRWNAAGGAALAMAVLVRPTNALLAPALIVLLGLDARRLAFFVLGGLPGAVWLALYNHHLYGGALRSGYGSVGEAFALHYGVPTAVHFARWLALMLPAVLLVLPFAALRCQETRGRKLFALGLAFTAIVGVYLFYDVSHDVWWCLRFILPAVAALILAGLLGTEALARGPGARWPRAFRPVMAAGLTVWALALSWYWVRDLHVLYVPRYERAYGGAAQMVRERLPDNALVVCSVLTGTLYYYTDFPTLVYDSITPGEFARYVSLARSAGRPIYAAIFNIEEDEVLRTRCPGEWKRLASVDNIGLWQLQ
ncbi:MAG: hypothetical protein ACREH8_15540 [Opitutaceae bacterium]